MKQIIPFVISKAGTKPYWCLQNVRLGYGLGPKHAYALLDWQNNIKQHKDQKFPAGLAVPVYWNWTGTVVEDGKPVTKNWGHIGVRLPDGRIWTDGKYFSSVSEVSSNYLSGGSYLGWGESVESIRVVSIGGDMASKTRIKQVFRLAFGRDPDPGAYDTFSKVDTDTLVDSAYKSTERKGKLERTSVKNDDWYSRIMDLQKTEDRLASDLNSAEKARADLADQNNDKTRVIEEQAKQLEEANKLNEELAHKLQNCSSGGDPLTPWEHLIAFVKGVLEAIKPGNGGKE